MTAAVTDKRAKIYTLAGILLALFLGALDQTIVSTALPRIVSDLRGLDRYAWVATAYLLASTVLVPIYGKLADTVSRKAIELSSIIIFLAGSFLCGAAGELGRIPLLGDGMSQLIVFRGLQGIGGAGLFAMAFIIIADLFPPAQRARYQGLVGAVFGIASVVGPLVGGFLADNATGWIPGVAGWRWVFYVNLPFGIIALWFIIARMPKLEPRDKGAGVNILSAVLLVATAVPLILALELDKQKYPWGSPLTLILFAASIVMLGLFIIESRGEGKPVLDLTLFRNRVFRVANIALFFFGAAFLSLIIFLPLFMVNVLGVSATRAGVSIIPLSAGLMAGSLVSGQLVGRFGHYKRFMLGGAAIFIVGAALLSSMHVDIPYWQVTIYMVICGIGIGPTFPLFPLAIQNAVPPREIGQATSASQFFRQIGSTVGTAIMGAVLGTVLSAAFASNMQTAALDSGLSSMGGISAQFQGEGNSRFSPMGPEQIRTAINNGFRKEYTLIESVFRNQDKEAEKKLLNDPMIPDSYKAQLKEGTPAEKIRKEFDRQYQALADAIRADRQDAIDRILSRSRIPAGIQQQIKQTARAGDRRAVEGMLSMIKQQFEAQADTAASAATDQALSAIKAQLDAQSKKISDSVVLAVKKSFTQAITRIYLYVVFIIIAGLLVTLFIPEIPLRKTFAPEQGSDGTPPTPVS